LYPYYSIFPFFSYSGFFINIINNINKKTDKNVKNALVRLLSVFIIINLGVFYIEIYIFLYKKTYNNEPLYLKW